jgi:hypothetical protein
MDDAVGWSDEGLSLPTNRARPAVPVVGTSAWDFHRAFRSEIRFQSALAPVRFRCMGSRIFLCAFFSLLLPSFASAQNTRSTVVFTSREYQAVGRSSSQSWVMTLPDRQKVRDSSETCARQPIESAMLPVDTRLPDRSEHWNYLTSVSASPDGTLVLVGSQAGSSTSHFENYWLLDRASKTWRYVGGGNEAKWSPDSSTILWSTPRELAPIGRIHVWVVHLTLVDVRTLEQQPLTSGVSYESDFFWCLSNRYE